MGDTSLRVMITGAGRGIGRATALAFAASGSRVALLGRESQALTTTARECEPDAPAVVVGHADVRDEAAVAAVIDDIRRHWGGLDVLVNNAGLGRYAPFAELSSSEWTEMVEVNILGVANVTRAVLPGMVEQGSGHIVNMGSIRGIETIPGTTAYAATKFAMVGFSKALQQDLAGSGVRISVISPGGVKTDFGGIDAADKDESFLEPSAVAQAVLAVLGLGEGAWIPDLTILPPPGT